MRPKGSSSPSSSSSTRPGALATAASVIRIAGNPTGDSISVAVGDYRSEADEDEGAREREETKRLLYVALTRARDRLYLSAALKEGRLQPGRGSLADVWPASLLEAFGAAYAGAEYVDWAGPSALAHRFRVVMASQHRRGVHDIPKTGTDPSVESDFALISDTSLVRTSVAAVVAAAEDSHSAPSDDSRSDLLVGRLVHRLLQRFGMTAAVDETVLASTIEALRRREDTDAAADARAIPEVLARFAALRRHADVRAQYESGEVFHEVPFTCSVDGQIIRGAIDCLIRQKDGSIRILEFKTGRRRDEHERQAEFYKRAAAAVFPDSMIVINVLYA